MMKAVECFMLHETRRAQRWLRRYNTRAVTGCRHDAITFFDQVVMERLVTEVQTVPHNDPKWPKMCAACGYRFVDDDEWRVTPRRIYTFADDAEQCTLLDAPIGAMWYADWMKPAKANAGELYCGPDGRCLVVHTHGGDWAIDGPSSNGDSRKRGWFRDGNPPLISVTPDIVIGEYRARLHVGRLTQLSPARKTIPPGAGV